jgi:hypothetical protein
MQVKTLPCSGENGSGQVVGKQKPIHLAEKSSFRQLEGERGIAASRLRKSPFYIHVAEGIDQSKERLD